ncbi:LysR substrate-binding domain-containing protein [Massilia sp. W12]|uniref:LysR family transcriptional regulator n=1 Tax=Massilia sp. W12 TaxID=3126507 RepID=UPI0030D54C6B
MKYTEELAVFLEVARRGSFAQAARALNLPTTTISRKVQLLEQELDVKLFQRTTRALTLTEAGARLLPRAQSVLETIAELKAEAELHLEKPVGVLNLTMPTSLAQGLAPLFAEFLLAYPNLRMHFHCNNRNLDLTTHRIDFAFRLGPLHDSCLIALPLARIRHLLVGQTQFVAARTPPAHPSEIAHWPCVRSHVDGLLGPWRFVENGNFFDVYPENPVLSDDLLLSRRLVLQGVGLGYLPLGLVQKHLARGMLVSLHEDWLPPGRELFLVYTDKQYLPFKSRVFLSFIKEKQAHIRKLLGDAEAD